MKQAMWSQVLAAVAAAIVGCAGTDDVSSADRGACGGPTTVTSDFESGSIGQVQRLADTDWVLSLKDDNDNPDLPDTWRTWWYVRFDNVSTTEATAITVNNNVWPFLYVPVYSYDGRSWQRFEEQEVTQPAAGTVRVAKQFDAGTVWLARFYPYTLTDLNEYLRRQGYSRYLSRRIAGETQLGYPIEVLTITNPAIDDAMKRRIWLHARSHPAETGSSFVLEGLIDFLLGDDPDAQTLRSQFVFSIVPMHNIDGVVVGNYRTTPESENLESLWLRDPADPLQLAASVPQEVRVLRDAIAATVLAPSAIPVSVALNLHSSNSAPDDAAFFIPHFGPRSRGYSEDEVRLWTQQIALADAVEGFYGAGRIAPRPAEGGRSFVTGNFPESWWWANRGSAVMAMTLETVYGRAGFAPRWVTPADLRALGRAVALAMLAYHGLPVVNRPALVERTIGVAQTRSLADRYPAGMQVEDGAE